MSFPDRIDKTHHCHLIHVSLNSFRNFSESSNFDSINYLIDNCYIRYFRVQTPITSAGTNPASTADFYMSQLSGISASTTNWLIIYDWNHSSARSYGNKKHILTFSSIYQPFVSKNHHINVIIHITRNMKFLFENIFYRNILPVFQMTVRNCNSPVRIAVSRNTYSYSYNFFAFLSKKCNSVIDHLLN